MTRDLPGITSPERALEIARANAFDPLRGVYVRPEDHEAAVDLAADLLANQRAESVTGLVVDDKSVRTFSLTVEGEPVPKLQGAILKFGKHMSIRKNPKTRRYEEIVRERATIVWNGRPLIADTPIWMTVRFYRPIPRSFTKRQLQGVAMGSVRPITKPDNTNLVKAFEDGLNGVVFADDALVVDTHIQKWYSERPRVEVTLTW